MRNNKYTFWRLLSEKKIVIPIIQRDYAQGREGKEYVRKNFLEQLGKALFNEEKTELDFVYGTECKVKDTIEMFPLDGQQRLTTLWLLHWYVAYKAGKLAEAKEVLKHFSYETRTSSREFCEMLCDLKYEDTNDIVGLIKKQTWFFSAWLQDPTIKAMLVMLSGTNNSEINKGEDFVDGIEELFDRKENVDFKNCWDKLTSNGCPIHFNFQPLQSQELPVSDDLYIKMNARGKALTSFENFKADLIDWIYKDKHKELWGANDDEQNKNRALLVSAIDNQWTDIFWNNGKDIGRVDEIYFAFLNRYFYNLVITDPNNRITDKNASENKYYAYFNNIDEKMMFEDFGLYEHFLSKDVFQGLANVMKNYAKSLERYSGQEAFENILKCKWNDGFCFIPKYRFKDGTPVKAKDHAGNEIMDFTAINQMERVVFYAICKYFKEGAIDTDAISLKRWMRFVWNLVSEFDNEGPIIRNINAMKEAISYIDEIRDSHNVYEELAMNTTDNKTSLGRRFQEEIAKARKILETPTDENETDINEDIIIRAEQYSFFCGSIRFLFTDDKGSVDWSIFNTKWLNAQSYFDSEGVCDDYSKDALLLRYFIAHIDYWPKDYWHWNGYNVYCDKKDSVSWRQILLGQEKYVHSLLLNRCCSIEDLKNFKSKLKDEDARYCQEALVCSNILDKIIPKTRIRWNWDNFVLYPNNSSAWYKHYYISKRNDILRQIDKITISQHNIIDGTDVLLGDDISFLYNHYSFRWQWTNWVDMYEGDDKLYDRGGEYQELHTKYNGNGEHSFKNSEALMQELERCIQKYNELCPKESGPQY